MKTITLLIFLAGALACGAAPDSDWNAVQALRDGPGIPPADAPEKIVELARAHLQKQEKALSLFLAKNPQDPRRYTAALELAGVEAALGASVSDRNRVERSIKRLADLERDKSAPSKLRADAAFQRVTTSMQTVLLAAAQRPGEMAMARNMIVESAGNFASQYPEDRRAARLLAEAATILDDQPSRKRKLLEQASIIARDDGTKQRIRDDLKRLALLGNISDLSFATTKGGTFSLSQKRGQVVMLIFWAGWSPPSVALLADVAKFAGGIPAGRVAIATVSLDRSLGGCDKTLQALGISEWPTSCSGRGWEDPLARQLAINALPTIFIYDATGKLRTLNARNDYAALVRNLVNEAGGVRR